MMLSTHRFIVAPLTPPKVRELAAVLLQDQVLAAELPWMLDKSAEGALHEAHMLELQCAAGMTKCWGIVHRTRSMLVGAVLARMTMEGMELEVLCASAFWNQGVAEEVSDPLAEWLQDTHQVQQLMLPQ